MIETPCIEWPGSRDHRGYGRMWVAGRYVLGHRLAYESVNGPVPEGLEIDHLCRNRACVNAAHLEAVTHRENVLRGTSPAAMHAVKTHCPQGHAYDDDNTYVRNGRRTCRACNRAAVARYAARKQAES